MTLSPQEIEERLEDVSWQRDGDQITRTFTFEDFEAALGFVNEVAEIAESRNHHPDIDIRYNQVVLSLTTHDAGGLTSKDFELAAAVDAIDKDPS